MDNRRRRFALAIVPLAALAIVAAPHPSIDLTFQTHDVRDTAPHKLQAAVNLGVVAVSVLYTWSTVRFAPR